MREIHKSRGVPFKLTIQLSEIKAVPVDHDKATLFAIEVRIHDWAKEKFTQKKTTVKYCQYWEATEFDNGETQRVLFIEGHMYGGCSGQDVSDQEAETALTDFEEYIKNGNINHNPLVKDTQTE